jgi:hypothetical protein
MRCLGATKTSPRVQGITTHFARVLGVTAPSLEQPSATTTTSSVPVPSHAPPEGPSLVLVINDTKLLMPCVKCFELGISNTRDEGASGME